MKEKLRNKWKKRKIINLNYTPIYIYVHINVYGLIHMYLHIFHFPSKGDKFDAIICLLVL